MAYYSLPDLPYDYAALEPHLSGRILELHHDKHHKAYVDGANKVMERLQEARATSDASAVASTGRRAAVTSPTGPRSSASARATASRTTPIGGSTSLIAAPAPPRATV